MFCDRLTTRAPRGVHTTLMDDTSACSAARTYGVRDVIHPGQTQLFKAFWFLF
jgi:hypothetical protein